VNYKKTASWQQTWEANLRPYTDKQNCLQTSLLLWIRVPTTLQNSFSLTFPDKMN